MDNVHELAMLTAQMWGEANAESANPEQIAYAWRLGYLTTAEAKSNGNS